jgi:hypothetical protein
MKPPSLEFCERNLKAERFRPGSPDKRMVSAIFFRNLDGGGDLYELKAMLTTGRPPGRIKNCVTLNSFFLTSLDAANAFDKPS